MEGYGCVGDVRIVMDKIERGMICHKTRAPPISDTICSTCGFSDNLVINSSSSASWSIARSSSSVEAIDLVLGVVGGKLEF